ncbi:MAG: hypothetical protein QOH90_455 [Actinomycetota bacterium]|nr:hypothetical protein [Actinomycetota bacterium]
MREVISDRRRFRLISFSIAAACGLLLWGISPFVGGDRLSPTETTVFRWFNDLPGFLYRPLWPFMQLGNFVVIPAAVVVALLFRKWWLAAGIAALGLGKLYLGRVVKTLVVRHRPEVLLSGVAARDDSGVGQAFVSGHVVVAVGLATLIHPYLSPRWRAVAWTLAGLVAFGRLYVGAHFPLDVVGGAALGAGIACVVHTVLGPPHAVRRERTAPETKDAVPEP